MAAAGETALFSGRTGRPVRLSTLLGLRWLAVAGQTASVLVVAFGFGFSLPLLPCLALIGLSVLLNLFLLWRPGRGKAPTVGAATGQLAFDIGQLAGLLALTGGLQNPFALLLLAPVAVSASILPQRATVFLAGLAALAASLLSVFSLPLPWGGEGRFALDPLYVFGLWISLLCALVFITAYVTRVAHEARQLADALAATEVTLLRHEQLSALDGLAAAAAHELGTPLSTIALVAREMRDDVPPGPLAEDVDLIISQSARCRTILGKLRNLGADGGDPFAVVELGALVAEAAHPHESGERRVSIVPDGGEGPEPRVRRTVGLLYGLGNLIENATAYARNEVLVSTSWDKTTIEIRITDDGPGFAPDLLARLGEPYLTPRSRGQGGGSGGLGLGIFIAKTLLERTGGSLVFANADPLGHAEVRIRWARAAIEAATPRPAL